MTGAITKGRKKKNIDSEKEVWTDVALGEKFIRFFFKTKLKNYLVFLRLDVLGQQALSEIF